MQITKPHAIIIIEQYEKKTKETYDKMTSLSTISLLLLLSLVCAVISVDASFQSLPLPILMSGPQSFAFNSTEKGFYTGVSGGTILKYTPEKGFVTFARITESS